MVVDSRAKMNKFIMRISDLVGNGCIFALWISNMDISHVMFLSKQMVEQKLKKVCRELQMTKVADEISSITRFEVQDKPGSMKGFPIKNLQIIQGSTRLGFLLRRFKSGKVLDLI